MGMFVRIYVNDDEIEEIGITRQQKFDGNRVYPYLVQYIRKNLHPTAPKFMRKVERISHNFEDGSLVLVRKAIEAVLEE